MDEPTAVLAPQEAEELFVTLRAMTAAGRSVVFISHKLGEVLAIADRVTVMRGRQGDGRGHRPGRRDPRRPGPAHGRSVGARGARPGAGGAAAGSCSRCAGVSAENDRGLPALRDVSLEVRAGEIVGIAAVAGNGQAELAEVITGLRPCTGRIDDRRQGRREPARARGDRRGRRPRPRGPRRRRAAPRTCRSSTT